MRRQKVEVKTRIWMILELCEPSNCSDSAHILRYRSTCEFYRFRSFQHDFQSFHTFSRLRLAPESVDSVDKGRDDHSDNIPGKGEHPFNAFINDEIMIDII